MSLVKFKYRDRHGNTVSVLMYDERADLPVFDAEVIDAQGEVIEYIDPIISYTALDALARRRGWTSEVQS